MRSCARLARVSAALRLAPRTGPSTEAAHLYGSSANIIGFLGLTGLARRYGALSQRIGEAAGSPLAAGIAYQYTGHLAAFLGDLAAFEREMNVALEVYTRAGHQRFREEALTNLGYLYSLRGEIVRVDTKAGQREIVGRVPPSTADNLAFLPRAAAAAGETAAPGNAFRARIEK